MADEYEVEVLGQTPLISALKDAAKGAPEVLGAALYQEGELAFKQTQKEVPIRKGYLKNSGRLHQPVQDPAGNVEVAITYGSAAADYAAPTHDLNKNYRNGRKWHYVSDPVQARIPGMESRIVKRINRLLGG